MKRKNNAIGLLPLFVVILSAFGTVRAAEEAVLWPGDSLTKVMRSDMPKADSEQPLQIEAARAEIASSQAIFRPHENVASATVTITDLRHSEADAIIPASAVRLQWVRYIDINRNTAGIPDDELVVKAPASIPDPFWEAPSISIKAGRTQPVWIEVRVPGNAKAGDYHGKLLVTTPDESFEMPVKLHVWDFGVQ